MAKKKESKDYNIPIIAIVSVVAIVAIFGLVIGMNPNVAKKTTTATTAGQENIRGEASSQANQNAKGQCLAECIQYVQENNLNYTGKDCREYCKNNAGSTGDEPAGTIVTCGSDKSDCKKQCKNGVTNCGGFLSGNGQCECT